MIEQVDMEKQVSDRLRKELEEETKKYAQDQTNTSAPKKETVSEPPKEEPTEDSQEIQTVDADGNLVESESHDNEDISETEFEDKSTAEHYDDSDNMEQRIRSIVQETLQTLRPNAPDPNHESGKYDDISNEDLKKILEEDPTKVVEIADLIADRKLNKYRQEQEQTSKQQIDFMQKRKASWERTKSNPLYKDLSNPDSVLYKEAVKILYENPDLDKLPNGHSMAAEIAYSRLIPRKIQDIKREALKKAQQNKKILGGMRTEYPAASNASEKKVYQLTRAEKEAHDGLKKLGYKVSVEDFIKTRKIESR